VELDDGLDAHVVTRLCAINNIEGRLSRCVALYNVSDPGRALEETSGAVIGIMQKSINHYDQAQLSRSSIS
jgi:hypothetical protein